MFVEVGPDFLCVGMQKAGTGWLFDQLQFHPDFWMPPVKEFHYLSREVPQFTNALKGLKKAKRAKRLNKERSGSRRSWGEHDMEFLEEAAALSGKPLDLDKYAQLFRFKDKLISGDVTPGYSGLEGEAIEKIAARFPETRVLVLVRDPVSRAWSQLSMAHRREKFDSSLLADPVRFRRYLERYPQLQRVGYPARIVENWQKHAPKVNFRWFFFDDIASKPDETRADILTFLGADPKKSSGDIPPDHNRKASAAKLEMTDEIKKVLADFFKDEMQASAAILGGPAKEWGPRYGV